MRELVKKPGYMWRAVIAWFIFNVILLGTLSIVVWLLGGYDPVWYIQLPMILAVIVSEWVIMIETIAPVIRDWIKQEEYRETEK